MIRLAAVVALVALAPAFGSSTQWHPSGGARGDAAGDGRTEAVVVEQHDHRCEFRLVAGSSTSRVRPAMCRQKPSELIYGSDPHVTALVDIDRQPGLEVVVQDLARGVLVDLADVWTYRDGALRPATPVASRTSRTARVCAGHGRSRGRMRRRLRGRAHQLSQLPTARARRAPLVQGPGSPAEADSDEGDRMEFRASPTVPEFREPQPFPGCAKAR